jgi:hypothetical protein
MARSFASDHRCNLAGRNANRLRALLAVLAQIVACGIVVAGRAIVDRDGPLSVRAMSHCNHSVGVT